MLMAALADILLLGGEYEESLTLAQWVIDHEPDMKLKEITSHTLEKYYQALLKTPAVAVLRCPVRR